MQAKPTPRSPVPGIVPEPVHVEPVAGDALVSRRAWDRRDESTLRETSRRRRGLRSTVDPRTAGRGTPATGRKGR